MPTYPITLPTAGVYAERLSLGRAQQVMRSPYSGKYQAVDKFAQWFLTVNLNRMPFQTAEIWQARLNSLRGGIGTFQYSPWQSVTSTLTGITLASTLHQYSNVAALEGWAASAASALRLGQYFQIGNQLFQLTAVPANADEEGVCEVEFEPYARTDYDADAAVEFAAPKGLFRLEPGERGEAGGFTVDVHGYPQFPTLSAEEVL